MTDAVVQEWQERIRVAAAAGTPLRICGGGSKHFYGNPVAGELRSTRAQTRASSTTSPPNSCWWRGVARRSPTSRHCWHAHGQMLAFEPPHYGPGATLGGAIACGLSGPRRPYAGSVRDLLLGVRIVDGTGALLHFGGRVMKNVAGFDATRLMAGALGTLGVITEVALKCLPAARAEATLAFDCGADAAIHMANDWAAKPLPLTATCYWRGTLAVRLGGAEPAVATQCARSAEHRCPMPRCSGTACASTRMASSSRPTRNASLRCGGCRCVPPRPTPTWAANNWWSGAVRCAGSGARWTPT